MKYLYIVIIIALVISLIALVRQLLKVMKTISKMKPSIDSLNNNLTKTNEKVEEIKSSKESWSFFISIYIIYSVLKTTLTNLKQQTIKAAFISACIAHAAQLKKVKI